MSDKPIGILFRDEMMRANLNTQPGIWPAEAIDPSKPFKWQTRRTAGLDQLNKAPDEIEYAQHVPGHDPDGVFIVGSEMEEAFPVKCRYGWPGRVIWGRETYCYSEGTIEFTTTPATHPVGGGVLMTCYRSTYESDGCPCGKWIPSIHMKYEHHRFAATVKDVQCERVQSISEAAAIAEGFESRVHFADYFCNISNDNATAWDENYWVWVVSYARIAAIINETPPNKD